MKKIIVALALCLTAATAQATVVYEQYSNSSYGGNNPFSYRNAFVAQDFTISGTYALNQLTFNAYTTANTQPNADIYVRIHNNNNGSLGSLLYSQHISGNYNGIVTGTSNGYTLKDYVIDIPTFNIASGNYYLALQVDPAQWDMHWSLAAGGPIGGASYISYDGGVNYSSYGVEHEFRLSAIDNQPVPEPSTLILLGAGLVGLGFARKRFAKK